MDNIINIKFPFKVSEIGYYFDYNTDTKSALKSDILHILITKRGSRFFNREFGTRLHEFLFEQNDEITATDIKSELNDSLKIMRPSATIKDLKVEILNNHEVTIHLIMVDNLINNIEQLQINVNI